MRPNRVAEPEWSAWMLPSIYGVKLNRHRALLAEAERERLAQLSAVDPAWAAPDKMSLLRHRLGLIVMRVQALVGRSPSRSVQGSAR